MHIEPKVWVSQSVKECQDNDACYNEAGRVIFNDVSNPARVFKGKQMFMHHCFINGLDFEKYLGTGPNQAERPRDCKLILVYNTWSRFHNRH